MAWDRTPAENIDILTERLQTSTLLDDRRDACRTLRSMAKDYRVEVGAQAMESLLQAIKNDHHDTEIVNYCLDSLNYIISGCLGDSPAATWPESFGSQPLEQAQTSSSNTPHFQEDSDHVSNVTSSHAAASNTSGGGLNDHSTSRGTNHDPGRELAEIFLKKADNVEVILDRIGDSDFKIRWVALRLLCGLARQKLSIVQNSILCMTNGLSRLIQLITEKQELIRNDALVLFVRLTQTNQDIQNMAVFEDCFDKIMSVIEQEGYLDGTAAVVMDCLNILLNLTQYNEKNQRLFKDGGHIQKLMPFFNNIQTMHWTNEKTACLVLVLQIIDSMLVPSNSDVHVQACQTIMQRCGLLEKLCDLLTATSMPIGVLSETMNTASDIMRGYLGSYANIQMETRAMAPVLLLSMVKEMCQVQEKRIADLYKYMHDLHAFISNSCSK